MANTPDPRKRKTLDVNIAGISLKIRSPHTEEWVNDLVHFVDSKVQEALKTNKNGSFQNALLLATLNIAEELVLLKSTAHNELVKIEDKAVRILSSLENSKSTQIGLQN